MRMGKYKLPEALRKMEHTSCNRGVLQRGEQCIVVTALWNSENVLTKYTQGFRKGRWCGVGDFVCKIEFILV